jgi:hypothetical protein
MPDISMCPSQYCPVRGDCYRNEASGTRPTEYRQSWTTFTWRQPGGFGAPVECSGYWPTETSDVGSGMSSTPPSWAYPLTK